MDSVLHFVFYRRQSFLAFSNGTAVRLGVLALFTLTLAILLSACRGDPGGETGNTAEPGAEPASESAVTMEPATDGTLSSNRQLVIWLPDFAGYGVEGGADELLTSVFRQYEQEHPGLRIDVQVKADAGQSDLYSYLRSAQRVAPSVVPDLALIDSQHMWHLADLGVVEPLEISPESYSTEFYPFALEAMSYKDEWYGVPYAADILHTVGYPSGAESAPKTWSELLGQDGEYRFATAGADLFENGAVLQQYIGAGGQLMENGPTANTEALEAVFNFLVDGMDRGVAPATVTDIAALDGVWKALVEDGDGYGNVSASRYLTNREAMPDLSFAQTPTRNGASATLASTWALVILAQEEEQRELASELVDRLLAPSVQGPWSQYAHRLPTQRTAMPASSTSNPYIDFLDQQLEAAVALPNGRAFADFARRLFDAQLDVLRDELSPAEAAAAVSGPG